MTKQQLGGAADLRLSWPGKTVRASETPETTPTPIAPRVATRIAPPPTPAAAPVGEPTFGRAWEAGIEAMLPLPVPEPMLPPLEITEVPRALEISAPLYDELHDHATEAIPTPARTLIWGAGEIPTFSYLAGAAGCGKTYAVRQLAEEVSGLELVATTGIAAINIGGTTINSLLGYFDTRSLQEKWMDGRLRATLGKAWRSGLRILALDEVSMMDGDQLTYLKQAIDEVNTKGYVTKSRVEAEWEEQFGTPNLKLLLVGDFAQLPPVKAPFAFESPEWEPFGAHTTTLTQVRRQADADFILALRAARLGDARTVLDYFGASLQRETDQTFPGTTLLAKNESVDKYNWLRLSKLTTTEVIFPSRRDGELRPEWGGPPKPSKDWGIPDRLVLKPGALVMILANEKVPGTRDLLFVNGDLGEVVEIGETKDRVAPPNTARAKGQFPSVFIRLQRTGQVVEVNYIRREKVIPCDSGRRTELRRLGQEDRLREDGRQECVGWVEYLPVRVAYATTVHKCVAASTRMQTLRRGVRSIDELHEGDYLPTGVVQAVARTLRSAYRITTALGYSVIASADHRWVTESGLRETRALVVGEDRLQLAVGRPSGGQEFDEETAYWLGLLIGDGCYTDREDGTLHFTCLDHPELGEAFQRGAIKLGAKRCSWRKDRRGLHTTSRTVRQLLEGWGVDYVLAPAKRIPTRIWEAQSAAWGAFLRGLFDTDGSVGRSGVIFCTASQGLAQDVHELLLLLGVVARCQRYPGRQDPYYQVYIPARGLAAFRAHVGLRAVKKVRRLAETLPNRASLAMDGFDVVTAVDDLGIEIPMVDIEITAPHLTGFGPFVGHNSQGLSLDQVQVTLGDHFFKTPGMVYVALSRARTPQGLRLVGSAAMLAERCTVNPKLVGRFL